MLNETRHREDFVNIASLKWYTAILIGVVPTILGTLYSLLSLKIPESPFFTSQQNGRNIESLYLTGLFLVSQCDVSRALVELLKASQLDPSHRGVKEILENFAVIVNQRGKQYIALARTAPSAKERIGYIRLAERCLVNEPARITLESTRRVP